MERKRKTKVGKFIQDLGNTGFGKYVSEKLAPEVVEVVLGNKNPLQAFTSIIKGDKSISENDKKVLIQELKGEDLKQVLLTDRTAMREVTKRWESDNASKSLLARNIRPASFALFSIAFVVGFFLKYELGELADLLKVIAVAYFSARTGEKIFKQR